MNELKNRNSITEVNLYHMLAPMPILPRYGVAYLPPYSRVDHVVCDIAPVRISDCFNNLWQYTGLVMAGYRLHF